MALGNRIGIVSSTIDNLSVNTSYVSPTADATALRTNFMNTTGVALTVRVVGGSDTLTLNDGISVTLYGDPSGFEFVRASGSGAVSLQMIIEK